MKPRIFIGSSIESLDIAYAIQENLQYDANVTVWSQGVFRLSSNTITDLLNTIDTTDYAIFVFSPDDIINIRNTQKNITRDNVIFEFGLFIGKLGKEKVFYLIPNDEDNLHLPTDLLGITPGKFYSKREDGNIVAALGPFCNQVRTAIKDFKFNNLSGLENESIEAKKIVINQPPYWEYLLFAELLEQKINPILSDFDDLFNNVLFVKSMHVSEKECLTLLKNIFSDFGNFFNVFWNIITDEFDKAIGPSGSPGNAIEIKGVANKIVMLLRELYHWEYHIKQITTETQLNDIKSEMSGWSKAFLTPLSKLPVRVRNLVQSKMNGEKGEYAFPRFDLPEDSMQRVQLLLKNYIPTGL
jgi:hypothetical protein